MDLQKKIEEIRSKPEHIREKYLWIAMAISTIIVVGIWFLSIRMSFLNKTENKNDAILKESIQEAKDKIELPSEIKAIQ